MRGGITYEEALRSIPHHIWSSEPDVGEILSSLIAATNARVVVESGVWFGKTSISMINALDKSGMDCVYIGIDVEDKRPDLVKEYMNDVPNVECVMHIGSSLKVLPTLTTRCADIIFIDSVHELEYLTKEFKLSEKIIKQDGIIALHDSIHVEGVRRWVDYIKTMSWFEVINLPTSENRGLALVKCLHA